MLQHDSTLPKAKDYCSYHDSKDTRLPTKKPLVVSERSCPSMLLQRVHSYPRGSLWHGTSERSASYPIIACNHSLQNNWVTWFHLQGHESNSTNNTYCIFFKVCVFYFKLWNKNVFLLLTFFVLPHWWECPPLDPWCLYVPLWECSHSETTTQAPAYGLSLD